MRFPLFVLMQEAKRCVQVPGEIRRSGILSLHYLRENGMRLWTFSFCVPKGSDAIAAIAERIYKNKPAKESTYLEACNRIAKTIYTATSPLTNYINRNHFRCGSEYARGLLIGGDWTNWANPKHRVIPIAKVPTKPCRWCGAQVEFKPKWVDHRGQVRCNSRDCRRMDYLRETPQSRGGIDLTPAQRKELDYEAWDTQRALNYFNLIAKEIKHGRRTNHDLRRRSPHGSANHL